MKKKMKKDPYSIRFGNLFILKDGVATVTLSKYAVLKKNNFLGKPKFIAYPGEKEILVGNYEIKGTDCDNTFLIGSKRLSEIIGFKKITSLELTNFILANNDSKVLLEETEKILKK